MKSVRRGVRQGEKSEIRLRCDTRDTACIIQEMRIKWRGIKGEQWSPQKCALNCTPSTMIIPHENQG